MSHDGPPPQPGPPGPSGQPPYQGPPYQGQPQPYAQPGQWNQPGPPRKDNTTRNVLLIIGGILVLILGSCAAVAVVAGTAFDRAADEIDEVFETEPPIEVSKGDGFSYDGFEVDSGWEVTRDEFEGLDITGLRVTSVTDAEDAFSDQRTASFEFQLFEGNTLLTETTCRSDSIREDEASTLTCNGGTLDEASGFDPIKVADVL